MTQQLKEMIERVKIWPEWRQEDAAYLLEMIVREGLESPGVSAKELKAFRNRHKT